MLTFRVRSRSQHRYNDGVATEYRGGRSLDALQKWAVKAGSAAGVREIAADELTRIAKSDDVFFLYLHSPGTPAREAVSPPRLYQSAHENFLTFVLSRCVLSRVQAAVETASKVLIGTPVKVYRSSDPVLLERYHSKLATGSVSGSAAASSSTSGLLVFKDHKPERPTSAFYPSTLSTTLSAERAAADVGNWLTRERYPTVSEVTGATSTDILYNKQHALVVLAALSDEHHGGTAVPIGTGAQERDMELKTLRALALQWRNAPRSAVKEDILFAWLDADRFASFIKKSEYRVFSERLARPECGLADP